MEALQGGLHDHKENVEASVSRGKVTFTDLPSKARTPGGKLQPYSTPKSTKAPSKSSSTTKKPRRALGDISNQHRTPNGNQSNADVLGKRESAGALKANANSTTPASAKKARASVVKLSTPKRAPPVPEKIEEIEFAYGGLPSYGPDPAYLERIREEIVRELHDDTKPSIMDQYTIEDKNSSEWKPDKSMLNSGGSPTPWWASDGAADSSFTETITWSDDSIQSTLDLNTPELDACDELPTEDKDDLLDEILNIDIPVSID